MSVEVNNRSKLLDLAQSELYNMQRSVGMDIQHSESSAARSLVSASAWLEALNLFPSVLVYGADHPADMQLLEFHTGQNRIGNPERYFLGFNGNMYKSNNNEDAEILSIHQVYRDHPERETTEERMEHIQLSREALSKALEVIDAAESTLATS